MKALEVLIITPSDPHWPRQLSERLTTAAPAHLWILENRQILGKHKMGFFCSLRCPEDPIVTAQMAAGKFCQKELTMVSGFPSPTEKYSLRIPLKVNSRLLSVWRGL